jgi:hypothetical protein
MALIKCKEWGKPLSDEAEACPHCGFKIASQALAIKGFELKQVMVALFASLLSVISLILTSYQWYVGQHVPAIKLAIDISESYLADKVNERNFHNLLVMGSQTKTSNDSQKINLQDEVKRYVMRLNHIAWLALKGQLDDTYLADEIKCDIFAVDKVLPLAIQNGHSFPFIGSLTEFENRHPRSVARCDDNNS